MQSKPPLFKFLQAGCLLSAGPDEFWIGWGDFPRRVSQPLGSGLNVYAPDFFLKDPSPWWSFSEFMKVSRAELLQMLQAALPSPTEDGTLSNSLQLEWTGPDFEQFRSSFLDLQFRIEKGLLQKAVPVVFQRTQNWMTTDSDFASRLECLLQKTQGLPLFVYGVWDSQEGMLGASPEILFEVSAEAPALVRTVALAGTRLKSSSGLSEPQRLPLLSDAKELHEHRLVIQGIEGSLQALGAIHVGQTQELELPTLSHLYTPIELKLDPSWTKIPRHVFFSEIVKSLHPTPALGAFPKDHGRVWLETRPEAHQRRRFGAPFGIYLESGESRCVVAIRNIQWDPSTLQLGAGCGVVGASVLEREWNELLGKMNSIKKLFGLSFSE